MNSFSYFFPLFCHKLHLLLVTYSSSLSPLSEYLFMIALPIFRSIPARVVGIPVVLAISRFTLSIPNRRLHEKETPGILRLLFFPIVLTLGLLTSLFYGLNSSLLWGLSSDILSIVLQTPLH